MRKELIQKQLSESWFLGKKTSVAQVSEEMMKLASCIIEQCQITLAKMHDPATQRALKLVIRDITKSIQLVKQYRNQASPEIADKIINTCKELTMANLSIPSGVVPDKYLTSASYKTAVVCFYLLALSVAIAVGATFGAWYFSYLASGYFLDSLAFALSIVGIPATCLGLMSYGIYQYQDKQTDDPSTLPEQIHNFCNLVIRETGIDKLDDMESDVIQVNN